jgi:uncharacterized protein (DUF1810 family)
VAAIDLERFIDAQNDDFVRALGEIEAGRKRSHWMWYVFPQVAGLGASSMSKRYAIESVAEAEGYLAHPILGARYRQIVDAVWHQVVERGTTIRDLFGSPDDAKLMSSLGLFAGVARRLDNPPPDVVTFVARSEEILHAGDARGLARCTTTQRWLDRYDLEDE